MKITKRQLRRIIREAVASDSSIIPVEELEWAPEPGQYGKTYMRLAFASGEDVIDSVSTPEEFETWKAQVISHGPGTMIHKLHGYWTGYSGPWAERQERSARGKARTLARWGTTE